MIPETGRVLPRELLSFEIIKRPSSILFLFVFLFPAFFFLFPAFGEEKRPLPKISKGKAQLVTLPQFEYAGTIAPITVTGEWHYPTPVVLLHLGLSSWISVEQERDYRAQARREILYFHCPDQRLKNISLKILHSDKKLYPNLESYRGKKILSLGEGYSGLVPFLNRHKIHAFGLDLWYDENIEIPKPTLGLQFMQTYRKRFKDSLITSDATRMRDIPDKTYDMVVSHFLFEYLDKSLQTKMLEESLRVLKPGGLLRYAFHANPSLLLERDGVGKIRARRNLDSVLKDTLHNGGMIQEMLMIKLDSMARLKGHGPFALDTLSWKEYLKLRDATNRDIEPVVRKLVIETLTESAKCILDPRLEPFYLNDRYLRDVILEHERYFIDRSAHSQNKTETIYAHILKQITGGIEKKSDPSEPAPWNGREDLDDYMVKLGVFWMNHFIASKGMSGIGGTIDFQDSLVLLVVRKR